MVYRSFYHLNIHMSPHYIDQMVHDGMPGSDWLVWYHQGVSLVKLMPEFHLYRKMAVFYQMKNYFFELQLNYNQREQQVFWSKTLSIQKIRLSTVWNKILHFLLWSVMYWYPPRWKVFVQWPVNCHQNLDRSEIKTLDKKH